MSGVGNTFTIAVLFIGAAAAIIAFVVHFMREVLGLVSLFGHSLTPLATEDRETLQRWSPFYAKLDPAGRKRFERRVKELVFEKEWVGKGVVVTREMRTRIAATAAQVCFGFDRLLLLHFQRILVFPGSYINRRTGNRHQGEVMPARGTIVLSWSHFVEGDAVPTDGHNVGLHEMAHALWFENTIENQEDDFFRPAELEAWKAMAAAQIGRIQQGTDHFLEAYAATNQAEFFAVAAEHFFERPVEFSSSLPELYRQLAQLLRQDPPGTVMRD